MQDKVRDLSNVYGFGRLYKTLLQDEAGSPNTLFERLYEWYCSNIAAYNNACHEDPLIPLEKEIFGYHLQKRHGKPYLTDIQTIKALALLDWNMSEQPEYAEAQRTISAAYGDYAQRFYVETGYCAQDTITSFSLCEDTLDPDWEPDNNFNPQALVRKYDTGPKLVYICAPHRGDVQANIAFATAKAREVFEEGNIPVCPHLMFPPIADPNDPAEDKTAMEMCKKLIDRCSEIRVCGSEWSEGMWDEIRYAEQRKIPVLTDQKEVPSGKRKCEPCR